MPISPAQLQRLQQSVRSTDTGGGLPSPQELREDSGPSFGDTLNNAINSVDSSQKVADEQIEAFVAGEQENVHDVMIAMNQAKLHFQLMTEVRNKSIEAYQELMRIQV